MENQTKAPYSLNGKKVVLLGGSSGIGLATAKASAAEGAQVIIVSGNQQRIDKALTELPQGSRGYAVNLTSEQSIKDFFEMLGNIDHLVYTAGENLTLNLIAQTDIERARGFFNVRYWGAFTAVKYASPHIQPGGSINLISGTANARPGAGWSIASSICGAMEGLVRALAVELAPIRVNSVVPGVIQTGLWDSMPQSDREGLFKAMEDTLLLKRVGQAEDVALAYVYLMKQQFGTGQNITVDGGTVLV
ncbi:SDR family oxidoreductase [Mucilaginibacter flavus]|uniref:SDR family oxidoreductase n=1 Tax=Mucilaginibacter flavus TaxID=931504 RepID=UPI0025B5BDBD|nr:SDR family oxidoreductase [Mucilaginibacter flavus]MDN3584693.1 SDR family oxidoreductase [Mucilaginibacter flavus]